MKRLTIYIIVFAGLVMNVQSEKINNTNYYNHSVRIFGSTDWLRKCDAVPVIIDEILKSGISYSTIGVGELVRLNDSTNVRTMICKNGKWKECSVVKSNDSTKIISRVERNGVFIDTCVRDFKEINFTHQVVLTISFFKNNQIYGFIFEDSHSANLDPHHRDFFTDKSQYNCDQMERNIDRPQNDITTNFIKPLPDKSIFLLKETCYWYQTMPDGHNAPVSKEVAIEILRQDIQDYLKKVPR